MEKEIKEKVEACDGMTVASRQNKLIFADDIGLSVMQ